MASEPTEGRKILDKINAAILEVARSGSIASRATLWSHIHEWAEHMHNASAAPPAEPAPDAEPVEGEEIARKLEQVTGYACWECRKFHIREGASWWADGCPDCGSIEGYAVPFLLRETVVPEPVEGDPWEVTYDDVIDCAEMLEDQEPFSDHIVTVMEHTSKLLRARVQPRRVSAEEFEAIWRVGYEATPEFRGLTAFSRAGLKAVLARLGIEITPPEGGDDDE